MDSKSRVGKIAYAEVEQIDAKRIAELNYYQRKAGRDGKGVEVAIAMDFALQVAFQDAARVLREELSPRSKAGSLHLSFSFPIGGMRAVERLRRCCATDELLILVADNGHESLQQANSPSSIPRFVTYGSISFVVNFSALRGYALASEGMFFGSGPMAAAMNPMFTNHRVRSSIPAEIEIAAEADHPLMTHHAPPLPHPLGPKICSAYLPGSENAYTSTQMLSFYRSTAFAYSSTVQSCPPHAFFDLLEGFSDEELSPGAALRVLQLSKFDPVVFVRVANALLDQKSARYNEQKLRAALGDGDTEEEQGQDLLPGKKSDDDLDFPDPYAARFALAASRSLSLLFDVKVLQAAGLYDCGTTWQDAQASFAHLVGRVLHLLRHEQLDVASDSPADSALSMDASKWFKLAREFWSNRNNRNEEEHSDEY